MKGPEDVLDDRAKGGGLIRLPRVRSVCTLPPGWREHQSIDQQRLRWQELLGVTLPSAEALDCYIGKRPAPLKLRNAFAAWEGPFVLPTIATLLTKTTRHRDWPDYHRALDYVAGLVKELYGTRFLNWIPAHGPSQELPVSSWWLRFRRFEAQTLDAPATLLWGQTGMAYRGLSARVSVCSILKHPREIGMTSIHSLLVLASLPDRFQVGYIGIDSVGSFRHDISPRSGERFRTPAIEALSPDRIVRTDFWNEGAADRLGAGSLILPQGF